MCLKLSALLDFKIFQFVGELTFNQCLLEIGKKKKVSLKYTIFWSSCWQNRTSPLFKVRNWSVTHFSGDVRTVIVTVKILFPAQWDQNRTLADSIYGHTHSPL